MSETNGTPIVDIRDLLEQRWEGREPRQFDRDGKPIGMWTCARLMEDRSYQIVRQEELRNGRWVSTVWLGLNHQYGEGPPLVFETMVFASAAGGDSVDCDRYSTEAEALAGHEAMVKRWGGGKRIKKSVRLRRIARQKRERGRALKRMWAASWRIFWSLPNCPLPPRRRRG